MKKNCFFALVMYISGLCAFSQTYTDYLTTGLDAYARSDWASAVFSFQKAIEHSDGSIEEASYWLVMANASAKNYQAGVDGAENFLRRHPSSRYRAELVYQQGRMYCLQSEHEKSINTLYGFLRDYPDNIQAASAYYWIGENLYEAGRLKEARSIFSRVISDFPSSAKVEPSRYKIALIDQGAAHDELLKLLKISHEELLKLSEEYEKSKKMHEQTVDSYQKQIAEIHRDTRTAELAEKLQLEKRKNEELMEKLALLELKNRELESAAEKANEADKADAEAAAKRKAAIDALKEKARILENMYDSLNGGNQK